MRSPTVSVTWFRLCLLLAPLLFAACGGGSSDGGVIIIDGNPPTVRSTAPITDAAPVAVTVTPMVTFSEAMDGSSLTASTFSLSSGAVSVAGTVTTQGALATFTPSALLLANTVYTATVSSTVRNLSGTSLQTSHSWNFTTEAQPWSGVRQAGTTATDSARGVALDSSGNIYLAGSTLGALDGNLSAGGEDLFLLKYAPTGILLWSRQFGTVAGDAANAVAVDSSGNVYVAGFTLGSLPGAPVGNSGGSDLLLIKYDGDGNRLWVRQLGSAGTDEARGVAVDAGGNAYVAGLTSATLPGIGNVNAGGEDLFLVKYDATGVLLWTRQFGTVAADRAEGVTVAGGGAIVVAGLTFGTFSGNLSSGGNDAFLIAYGADGTRQWVRQFGTVAGDAAQAVAADASEGVYVAGTTLGRLDGAVNAGGSDLFVARYDSAGNRQWSRQLGSIGTDSALGVAAGARGDVYLTGSTSSALDGNLSAGGEDLYLVKYDPLGNKQWSRQFGSVGNELGRAIAVDRGGNAFVGGGTTAALPGQISAGGEDLFLVKYDTTGTRQ